MLISAAQGLGREIVVVGAGGHAKVAIECLRFAGWTIIGCTDVDPTPRHCAGAPVLGGDALLSDLRSQGVAYAFCALGSNALRERVGQNLIESLYAVNYSARSSRSCPVMMNQCGSSLLS